MRSGGCRITTVAAGIVLALSFPLHCQELGTLTQPTGDAAARAYNAIKAGDLPTALAQLQAALLSSPESISLRKDLAYTLLKVGKPAEARDQFAEVVKRDPKDSYAALEYAFLCHETGKRAEAYALFRSLRHAANAEHRTTAQIAFEGMEKELTARIARLKAALQQNPADYSAHVELARATRERNEPNVAAAHFREAFGLKPQYPELLLELAEAHQANGDEEEAKAAWLAASHCPSAYVAEQAKEHLPARYPYLYEFQNAVKLHPGLTPLRREMAFFLLSQSRAADALAEFQQVVATDPKDFIAQAQLGFLLLEQNQRDAAFDHLHIALETSDADLRARVAAALRDLAAGTSAQQPLPAVAPRPPVAAAIKAAPAPALDPAPGTTPAPADAVQAAAGVQSAVAAAQPAPAPIPTAANAFTAAEDARAMGRKSYDMGFLPDAIRFFRQAHELDPTNFDTILRLAWSLNMAGKDQEAIQWFFLAARSQDPAIALEANKALMNLTAPAASGAAMARSNPEHQGVVASLWAMPLHSTRWGSTFAYAQAKAELHNAMLPFVPYASLRFVGDTTGAVGGANPQFLSENAFILGLGMRTRPWNGLLFWGEAGSAMAYLGSRRDQSGSFVPDYRGGLSHFYLHGPSVQAQRPGWFAETMNDLVYIHRFDRDTLAISRNRVGRHFGSLESLGGLQFQAYFNLNANTDFKRQAWANFVEAGPGVRFRCNALPPPVSFTFNYLRGHHTIRRIDGRPNTYTDVQAGLWYAYSR